MNPDQNEYPIDYLNQIAPQQKQPMMSKKLLFIIIGGVILLAIIGVIAISSSGGGAGPTQKMQTLAARLQTLQKIASTSQKSIKSGALRSTNSNLTLYLTNTNRDIVAPLASSGVDAKKIDKDIANKEKGDALTKKLEDARLNAVFDRTYTREMTYQLDTVTALMKDLYSSSKSKSFRDFLVATDKGLTPIKKQLAEFNAANG